MTKWLQWIVLTSITGSPLLSIVILIAVWWVLDQYSLRLLPNPFKWFGRLSRMWKHERLLLNNPNDRKARFDLAEIYLSQKRYAKAMQMLRPNLEHGDDDARTLFAFGIACLGAGHVAQGEKLLLAAQEADPNFRMGDIDLELGRWRLKRGEARAAVEALERFVDTRRGTVEGRALLAKALDLAGDDAKGALVREEAWSEYRKSPSYLRRAERFWAWRAKPSRPIAYAALLLLLGAGFSTFVAPTLKQALQPYARSAEEADPYLAEDQP